MPAGRPLLYETPEQMQVIIDQYFEDCIYNRKWQVLAANGNLPQEDREVITDDLQPTISGLAYVLDMDRKTFLNYQGREEFIPTLKKARVKVESAVEQRLFAGHAAGPIFNLKNNFDWKDKQETELSGHLSVGELSDAQLQSQLNQLIEKAKG